VLSVGLLREWWVLSVECLLRRLLREWWMLGVKRRLLREW
jgi:hypothetical protein